MKVIYVGELDRTPLAPDHMGIRQGAKWMGWDFRVVDPILNSPGRVIELCNEFNADLIIHGNTDSLANNIIPHIKGQQVFFMGDLRREYDEFPQWVENSKGLSHVLISNRDQIPMWSEAFGVPASFWPHGCYVPEELKFNERFAHDLVFIGGMNNSWPFNIRFELISDLSKRVNITHIDGAGVEGRNEVWRNMPEIYHSSKITLDISHFWGYDGYASGRYWYSAGLGGCSVTKRFPGCEEFYEDKKEKWYFDTIDEAVDIINFIWKHPEVEAETKINAYERNKQDHNYKIRFQQLLEAIKQ